MAGTYGNLGVLYATGIKNETKPSSISRRPWNCDPTTYHKEMSSPEVKDLFQRAHSEMENTSATPFPTTPETSTRRKASFAVQPRLVARRASSLKLRCVAEGSLPPAR